MRIRGRILVVSGLDVLDVLPAVGRDKSKALLDWKAQRLAECGPEDGPTPTAKKVYRLHLRTKRTTAVR